MDGSYSSLTARHRFIDSKLYAPAQSLKISSHSDISSTPHHLSQKPSVNSIIAPEPEEQYSSDESGLGAEATENYLLFKDSGYGNGGMLPGLKEPAPISSVSAIPRKTRDEVARTPRKFTEPEGEATKGLRRLREKLSNLRAKEKAERETGVVEQMQGLSLK